MSEARIRVKCGDCGELTGWLAYPQVGSFYIFCRRCEKINTSYIREEHINSRKPITLSGTTTTMWGTV